MVIQWCQLRTISNWKSASNIWRGSGCNLAEQISIWTNVFYSPEMTLCEDYLFPGLKVTSNKRNLCNRKTRRSAKTFAKKNLLKCSFWTLYCFTRRFFRTNLSILYWYLPKFWIYEKSYQLYYCFSIINIKYFPNIFIRYISIFTEYPVPHN